MYYEGTGAFTVYLSKEQLTVFHGSLGHSTPPIHHIGVVIFPEHSFASASIKAGIAE